jgi:hypothetical protein
MPRKRFKFDAERLAYWYFRLNGFLTVENFVLHDEAGGPQRTDVDLLAMRFPRRREALHDYRGKLQWMQDDCRFSAKETPYIAFVDVTTAQCKLNGPWTDETKANLQRALRATGALANENEVKSVARSLYQKGAYQSDSIKVQLVTLGRESSPASAQKYPMSSRLCGRTSRDSFLTASRRTNQSKMSIASGV